MESERESALTSLSILDVSRFSGAPAPAPLSIPPGPSPFLTPAPSRAEVEPHAPLSLPNPSSHKETSTMADSGAPLIGSLLSVTTKSNIRYEGIMCNLDISNSTVALQNGALCV